jgi:magnesium-transporting ATPase (P-type)
MNLSAEKIEIIQKIILIATGFFVVILKIKSYFSLKTMKQDLKQDIEIFEVLNKQNKISTQNIETKIKDDIAKIYDPNQKRESGIFGFLMGIAFFIGFGWWSFDIYNINEGFNGWIILTMLISFFGLSTILMDTSYTIKNEPFFKIGFYEKTNLRAGLILVLVSGILLYILLTKLNKFSVWEILTGILFLYGLMMIIKCIRKIK